MCEYDEKMVFPTIDDDGDGGAGWSAMRAIDSPEMSLDELEGLFLRCMKGAQSFVDEQGSDVDDSILSVLSTRRKRPDCVPDDAAQPDRSMKNGSSTEKTRPSDLSGRKGGSMSPFESENRPGRLRKCPPCPICGRNEMRCYGKRRHGSMVTRFYGCQHCQYTDVWVESADGRHGYWRKLEKQSNKPLELHPLHATLLTKLRSVFHALYRKLVGPGKWPNFTPKEIACKCCGEIVVDEASMDALQRLRDIVGRAPRHQLRSPLLQAQQGSGRGRAFAASDPRL